MFNPLVKLVGMLGLMLVILTGCGFHLQSQSEVPSQLKTLYLTGSKPFAPFMQLLRENLERRNVTLTQSAPQAPFTLNVTSINLTTAQTSLSTSQQTRQYNVTYTVIFEIQQSSGKVVAGPFTVTNTQNLTLFSGQLIDNTNQLSVTEQQLQRQTINEMFYLLTATDTINALKK